VATLADKLFGGRLNASCALDGESASLQLVTAVAGASLRGFFQAAEKLRFRNRASGRLLEFPIETVRGIHFDQAHHSYIVYFNAENISDSRLLRETNLVPDPAEETIDFISDNVPKSVRVGDIVRYSSGVR
jgi:hypothetical protein